MPYIARDPDGELTIFSDKPIVTDEGYYDTDGDGTFTVLPSDWFPALTADDGPAEIVGPGKAVIGNIVFDVRAM